MGITDMVAEKIAKGISPSDIVKKVGELFREEIRRYATTDFADNIRAVVSEYFASRDNLAVMHELISRETARQMAAVYPILVIDGTTQQGTDEFKELTEKYALEGPLGTVNAVKRGAGAESQYQLAIEDIIVQARKSGMNIIVLNRVRQDSGSQYAYPTCSLMGSTYRNTFTPN